MKVLKRLTSVILAVALTLSVVTVVAPTAEADTLPNYIKFEGTEEFTIAMVKSSTRALSVSLQYSTDGTNWIDYSDADRPTVSSSNKVIYFRGTNTKFAKASTPYNHFVINPVNNGTIEVSGNIMALLNYQNPSTTLTESFALASIFRDCPSITSVPELPATTLSERCYEGLFRGCTGLTEAPELPVKTLAPGCYVNMFRGCTGLTKAPELPAETLVDSCYMAMFNGCTGLTEAPELPAETLASKCYNGMFGGCTGLTEAPELPATTLADNCYCLMFRDCTGLISPPELKATTLANECYAAMFDGCTNLKMEETTDASKALWIMPSSTTATEWNDGTLTGTTGSATSVEAGKMYKIEVPKYVKFEGTEEFTIAMQKANDEGWNDPSLAPSLNLEYSIDGTNWITYSDANRPFVSSSNKVIYFRGMNNSINSYSTPFNHFVINPENNGTIEVSGNIYALLNYQNPPTTLTTAYALSSTFRDCPSITSVPELPATTLSERCYEALFQGCTGLTKAPELPATTLAVACYFAIFNGCTGLTEAPELPATTLAESCYSQMFDGCTGLTEAPELKATTLVRQCYSNMFNGCTGLTEAPELKATTLANYCYMQMFAHCTGLTEAPELKATTLTKNCYYQMFKDCTGLILPPELKATTLADKCYYKMFSGCTNLKMKETTDAIEALWVMPSSTSATKWNTDTLTGTTGTATSVETGKMYKLQSVYPYKVGQTFYETAASLNADIADGTVAEGSTITLTGVKPDGTIVLDGKDMTIDGSALDAIVLPDDSALVSATNKARVNVLGTMPTTDNDNTENAPIYSEAFIYLNGTLTTTGSVYQAKTVADFVSADAKLTENIEFTVFAEVAPKVGDEASIYSEEGTAGITTVDPSTGLYQSTIRNIRLAHAGNDIGLIVSVGATIVESKAYTTVNYLTDVAKADGASDELKTLCANLIIACKYINDVGTGDKGTAINLSAAGLEWIASAKTEDVPTADPMSINATTESVKIGAAGLHVTDKLNVYVKLLPRNELTFVAQGTYVMAYIDNGDGYETIAVTDSMVYSDDSGQNGEWYAYLNKLLPTQFGSKIKVELYTNLNALAQTLIYSVNTYCASMYSKSPALCTAIYNYGTAAEAYVAAQ